jgi:hypothetical protein
MAGGGISATGGAGVTLRIDRAGATTVRFDGMAPINFTSAGAAAGYFNYGGTVTAKIDLPKGEGTSGPWAPSGASFGNVTASATLTSPFTVRVLNNAPLAGLAGAVGAQAPVSGTPVLGAGRYTCTPATLVIAPPAATGVAGTWTLRRR